MAHLALYRKYRPQTFAGVVGQEENVRVLRAAVAGGRTVHAYLFCGTRGTGKTSVARILAKALNCQHPQNGEPCDECESCVAIREGRSLDVTEIDGASNRGIEEARDLLEKIHFAPVSGRFRVYIIDEVHMLTNDAFNALLKTFEEPPAHVVFILATTEARRVPLTILSRCQRYDFKPLSPAQISGNLLRIAAAENIRLDDSAAALLTAKAKGSMRDALSLLDQVGGDGAALTGKDVARLLGSVDTDFWPRFLPRLAAGDGAAVFDEVLSIEAEGKDIRLFFQDLQELLGDLVGGGGSADPSLLAQCRGLFSVEQLLTMITIIGEGEQTFRYNKDARLVYRFLMARLLRALSPATATATAATATATAPPPRPAVTAAAPPPIPAPAPAAPAPAPVPAAAPPPPLPPEDEDEEEQKARLLRAVRERSNQVFSHLMAAEIAIKGDAVTLTYGDENVHYRRMSDAANQKVVTDALTALLGRTPRLLLALGEADDAATLFD